MKLFHLKWYDLQYTVIPNVPLRMVFMETVKFSWRQLSIVFVVAFTPIGNLVPGSNLLGCLVRCWLLLLLLNIHAPRYLQGTGCLSVGQPIGRNSRWFQEHLHAYVCVRTFSI